MFCEQTPVTQLRKVFSATKPDKNRTSIDVALKNLLCFLPDVITEM